jgi:hypothetical protein
MTTAEVLAGLKSLTSEKNANVLRQSFESLAACATVFEASRKWISLS